MRKTIILVTGLIVLLSFFQCNTNMESLANKVSYTPLAVGDVKQVIYLADSSTTLISIVDKIARADGKEVFVEVWKTGTQGTDTSYYLVSDGYFKSTELDTVKDDSILIKLNPFREQRLAKSFPKEGDTFIQIPGSPGSSYWVAERIVEFETLFGTVDNVFAFHSGTLFTGYYGRGMGWIASEVNISDSTRFSYLCSYKKVSGKTYGELWPEKNPKGFANIQKKKALLNLLGHFSLNNKLKLD